MLSELAIRFHALFLGLERVHGTYNNIDQIMEGGKRKGTAVTVRQPVTDAMWAGHLSGSNGIGIVPIRDDNTVVFGAIDIDVYADLNHADIAAKLEKMGFPLIVCKSKSGGLHAYLFAAVPVTAREMQRRLQDIAARLGYGDAEIFPKQTQLIQGSNDYGSWINMPYFGMDSSTRHAVLATGEALTAEQFLARAEGLRQPAKWFTQPLPQDPDTLPDGPPCLQHLMAQGFPPGTWGDGTFNLGVYCRKAFPDSWKDQLARLNAKNFPPDKGWPVSDLFPIIRSLEKKTYQYSCSRSPLKDHCDKTECRRRKHGVGGANALPILSGLSKLATSPPTWFLEISGRRVSLTTTHLLNPVAFQELCAEHGVPMPVVSRARWAEHLEPYLATMTEISVADDGSTGDDSSTSAILLELLEDFCTGRMAPSLEEVRVTKKPYRDVKDGATTFRLSDFIEFTNRRGLREVKRAQVAAFLKEQGARNWERSISDKTTRLWTVKKIGGRNVPLPVPGESKDEGAF